MVIKSRKDLISEIQQIRNSKLLVYFTGDRQPIPARIAEDAVRPIYKHLLNSIGYDTKAKRIDLFLYSRGGDVSVPWRIVTMIREFCDEFNVLIPYKAHSATTMISLGADQIVMGRKAELGPIDPTLVRAISDTTFPPPEISVEDVSSYISFMSERANISDQNALAQVVSQLANQITPLTLGSVNRQFSHIRLVARKLLTSRKEKMEESKIGNIIEALTEKMYSHGHAIGRKEALELGLPIAKSDAKLEELMWNLFEEYEKDLLINEPLDPEMLFIQKNVEEFTEGPIKLAIIESESKLDVFEMFSNFRKKRQIPPNLQINLNIGLNLPPGFDITSLPQDIQQVIQLMITQVSNSLPSLIQNEITRQSPVIGIEGKNYGARWREI